MDASKILINVTGGEPLVRQDLCEVMEYATNELGFRWGMTTNGILLNDENIEKLKKANMETISISIDGLEETHDRFRGVPGSYKTIINNIKKLKEADFVKHLQVTTVFHKENINELNELYKVMLNLGLDSWRLVSMDPIGRANENNDLLLNGKEIRQLERTVSGYFDYIEDLIERENTFTMTEFADSVNEFLSFRRYQILKDHGKISRQQALEKAGKEYDIFNKTQVIESDFDKEIKHLTENCSDSGGDS